MIFLLPFLDVILKDVNINSLFSFISISTLEFFACRMFPLTYDLNGFNRVVSRIKLITFFCIYDLLHCFTDSARSDKLLSLYFSRLRQSSITSFSVIIIVINIIYLPKKILAITQKNS